jgi:hypothetical protein
VKIKIFYYLVFSTFVLVSPLMKLIIVGGNYVHDSCPMFVDNVWDYYSLGLLGS